MRSKINYITNLYDGSPYCHNGISSNGSNGLPNKFKSFNVKIS